MTNIHVLHTNREADQRELIEFMETWLERAKAGEFSAVAFAAVMASGVGSSKGWMAGSEVSALIGSIAILQGRLVELINSLETKV